MSTARLRALTRELDDSGSPVRGFFEDRFAAGLRDVQREYRRVSRSRIVVPSNGANPGTVGTAADWLLRFLVYPHPDVQLAIDGAARRAGPQLLKALKGLMDMLGVRISYSGVMASNGYEETAEEREALVWVYQHIDVVRVADRPGYATFEGPVSGSTVDSELLIRGCWVLALCTEMFRAGQTVFDKDSFPALNLNDATATDLLALAPPAAVDQLEKLRQVFTCSLLPVLAERHGPWALGPTFAGSRLVGGADADLIAAGLLLDIKTTASKPSLGRTDMWQILGYALLDFDNRYGIDSIGIYRARYDYLAMWNLQELIDLLTGSKTELAGLRGQFRQLLDRQH